MRGPARADPTLTARAKPPLTDAVRPAVEWLRRVRPAYLLVPLSLVQIGVAVATALSVKHNGWLWYSGGDATEYWAEEWSLAHGLLPHTFLGVGVPALYAWVPLVAGETLLHGLPVIIVLQVVIGLPLALVGIWAVADRLAGRLFAWWVAVVWIAGPLLFMQGFRSDYRAELKSNFVVPHVYGFMNMGDFPSVVLAIWATWAAFRAFDSRRADDALLAGALFGALVAVKPANAVFAAAPIVAFLVLRRFTQLAVAGAAAVPSLVALAWWKERGVGQVPVFALPTTTEASGQSVAVVHVSNRYLHFNWAQLSANLDQIREVFWSLRLLEFLAVAGALALIRRSPAKGIFVVAWFAGYCIVKGSSQYANVPQTSYWRLTIPGLVAFALLAAAVPLLVPHRPALRDAPDGPSRAVRGAIAAVAVLFVLLPLATVAAASPMTTPRVVRYSDNTEAPVASLLDVSASAADGSVRVSWRRPDSGHSRVWFEVFRAAKGDGCTYYPVGARECLLDMPKIATTQSDSLVDRPGRGRWWYRVAMVADPDSAAPKGDLMLMSPAVQVSVG
jgi:hypothetical protein